MRRRFEKTGPAAGADRLRGGRKLAAAQRVYWTYVDSPVATSLRGGQIEVDKRTFREIFFQKHSAVDER